MDLEQLLPAVNLLQLFKSLLLSADSLYQINLCLLFTLASNALENEAGHRDILALLRHLIVGLDLVNLSPLCLEHIVQKVGTCNIGNLVDHCP